MTKQIKCYYDFLKMYFPKTYNELIESNLTAEEKGRRDLKKLIDEQLTPIIERFKEAIKD
jgi:hypothetical protein